MVAYAHLLATPETVERVSDEAERQNDQSGGIAKLALVIGCSFKEAETFDAKYDHDLPFVKTTLKSAMRRAERQGYVETVLGRRQRFSLWEPTGRTGMTPLPREAALAA